MLTICTFCDIMVWDSDDNHKWCRTFLSKKEGFMEKIFSKYQKIILEVAKKFHEQGKERPRKIDYCSEVVKIYNKNPYVTKVTEQQARFQISRVIDKMSEGINNDLLCINGKYFVLNNDTYFKEKLVEECYEYLKDKIKVNRKDIMRISYNMCALLVELKNDNENTTVGDVFKNYLDDNCFEVLECENLLFILLKCNAESNEIPQKDSRENLIINVIESSISRIYENQEKEGLGALMRKRRKKQKKNSTSLETTAGS